jgi:hypothetical protein
MTFFLFFFLPLPVYADVSSLFLFVYFLFEVKLCAKKKISGRSSRTKQVPLLILANKKREKKSRAARARHIFDKVLDG